MTFLDFFSGIGGFRAGLEKCGMVCKGHCEIDKFADRSYRAIHELKEDEWFAEDITKVTPADLPQVNLWAGGFPCQDISVSGRQRGLAGKRSVLFFEIIRLLKGTPAEDRPEWIVLENVKNLLSVNQGWDFAAVLYSLAEIGYHIEYGLLNSKFHGVPQNRERIYLVAYRHFRAGGGRKVFPITAGNGKNLIQIIGGRQGKRVYDPAGISCTICGENGGFAIQTELYLINSRIRKLTPRECWRLQGFTDDMFDKAAAINSDTQLCKQAGNSVTIPVVYAIGKRIMGIQTELK